MATLPLAVVALKPGDSGHIAGNVELRSGNSRNFLLSPVPEPATWLLALIGLALLAAGASSETCPACGTWRGQIRLGHASGAGDTLAGLLADLA